MRTTTRSLTKIGLYLLPLVLGSAGCGDNYPNEWSPMPSAVVGVIGRDCPDLTGTWRVQFVREFSQSAFARVIGTRLPRFNWETLTIAGRTSDSLILTTRRSDSLLAAQRRWAREHGDVAEYEAAKLRDPVVRWREGAFFEMSDAEYADNIEKLIMSGERTRVLRHGTDYSCDDGRLISDRLLKGWYRDENGNPRDTIIGVVATGRNKAGDLVFEARYREEVKFAIWAETNAGIPLGTWRMHRWSRLEPTQPVVATPEPRPWAEPFVHPYPTGGAYDDRRSAMTPDEIAAIVRPVMPSDLSAGQVERAGRAFRLVVRATTTDAFARMFARLRQTQRFSALQVARLDGEPGRWEMDVRLVPGLRPSTMAADELQQRVETLLGSAVRVDSLRAHDGLASLYLVCTGRGEWQRAIEVLSRTREVKLASYMFDRLDPGDISRGWVTVGERVELYENGVAGPPR